MKRVLTIIVIVFLFGIILLGGYQYLKRKSTSYITIDINPSVELEVNSNEEVIDVVPLNDDADIITSDLDLEGLTVEEASEKIIDAATETGYIDDLSNANTVVVTSSSEDDDKRVLIEKKVIDRLNAHFENRKVYALVVAKGLDEELKTEADKYDIPYGKMLLIEKAVSLDSTLNKDELADMSIQGIQKTIKEYVKKRHDDMKLKREEARTLWQNTKKQKIEEFKTTQQAARETLWSNVKSQYKNATPTEKKAIIENLVKQKKEQIKSSLNNLKQELQQEKETIKQDVKEYRKNNYNYPVLEDRYNKVKEAVQARRNKQ